MRSSLSSNQASWVYLGRAVRPSGRPVERPVFPSGSGRTGAVRAGGHGAQLIGRRAPRQDRTQGAAEARDDILAGEYIVLPQLAGRAVEAEDLHLAQFGIDHPNQRHADRLVVVKLFLEVLGGIVGRNDFDGQVWRDLDLAFGRNVARQSALLDERDIGSAD